MSTASVDGTVQLCSVDGAAPLCTLRGHSDEVNAVAWDAAGSLLASGGEDKLVLVWDSQGGLSHTLAGHTDAVADVLWAPAGCHTPTLLAS